MAPFPPMFGGRGLSLQASSGEPMTSPLHRIRLGYLTGHNINLAIINTFTRALWNQIKITLKHAGKALMNYDDSELSHFGRECVRLSTEAACLVLCF